MNKNASMIGAGMRALATRPYEIVSGTVVSVDEGACTMTVQTTGDGMPVEGVKLAPVSGSTDGCILFPELHGNVVIGSIDGPGEWVLLRADKITKATIKIGQVLCELKDDEISLKNGNVWLDIGNTVFKMNTPSENLFDILKDLLTAISILTVPTPSGVSSPPVNSTDFTTLITRLSNLLTH